MRNLLTTEDTVRATLELAWKVFRAKRRGELSGLSFEHELIQRTVELELATGTYKGKQKDELRIAQALDRLVLKRLFRRAEKRIGGGDDGGK